MNNMMQAPKEPQRIPTSTRPDQGRRGTHKAKGPRQPTGRVLDNRPGACTRRTPNTGPRGKRQDPPTAAQKGGGKLEQGLEVEEIKYEEMKLNFNENPQTHNI